MSALTKIATRYASQPALPDSPLMGQNRFSGMFPFKPGSSITALTPTAPQMQQNPLAQPPKINTPAATTQGIQQAAKLASLFTGNAEPDVLLTLLFAHYGIPKQAETAVSGGSAPGAPSTSPKPTPTGANLPASAQVGKTQRESIGNGQNAQKSLTQQGNGGGMSGGGMQAGANGAIQPGVNSGSGGAFGVVQPGWPTPGNRVFGALPGIRKYGASPSVAGLPPTPGLTANQPPPPGPPGMYQQPPQQGPMPAPPPGGGAPLPGTGQMPGQMQPGQLQPGIAAPMQEPPPMPLPANPRMSPPQPQMDPMMQAQHEGTQNLLKLPGLEESSPQDSMDDMKGQMAAIKIGAAPLLPGLVASSKSGFETAKYAMSKWRTAEGIRAVLDRLHPAAQMQKAVLPRQKALQLAVSGLQGHSRPEYFLSKFRQKLRAADAANRPVGAVSTGTPSTKLDELAEALPSRPIPFSHDFTKGDPTHLYRGSAFPNPYRSGRLASEGAHGSPHARVVTDYGTSLGPGRFSYSYAAHPEQTYGPDFSIEKGEKLLTRLQHLARTSDRPTLDKATYETVLRPDTNPVIGRHIISADLRKNLAEIRDVPNTPQWNSILKSLMAPVYLRKTSADSKSGFEKDAFGSPDSASVPIGYERLKGHLRTDYLPSSVYDPAAVTTDLRNKRAPMPQVATPQPQTTGRIPARVPYATRSPNSFSQMKPVPFRPRGGGKFGLVMGGLGLLGAGGGAWLNNLLKKGDDEDVDALEAAAKENAQKSHLGHIRDGYVLCKCGARYYMDAKAQACCGTEKEKITHLRSIKRGEDNDSKSGFEKEANTALRRLIQIASHARVGSDGTPLTRFSMQLPGKGEIGSMVVRPGATGTPEISTSYIDDAFRGMGLGKLLYGRVMQQMPKGRLNSDVSVSPAAQRVWQSMAKRPGSYAVAKNPDARKVSSGTLMTLPKSPDWTRPPVFEGVMHPLALKHASDEKKKKETSYLPAAALGGGLGLAGIGALGQHVTQKYPLNEDLISKVNQISHDITATPSWPERTKQYLQLGPLLNEKAVGDATGMDVIKWLRGVDNPLRPLIRRIHGLTVDWDKPWGPEPQNTGRNINSHYEAFARGPANALEQLAWESRDTAGNPQIDHKGLGQALQQHGGKDIFDLPREQQWPTVNKYLDSPEGAAIANKMQIGGAAPLYAKLVNTLAAPHRYISEYAPYATGAGLGLAGLGAGYGLYRRMKGRNSRKETEKQAGVPSFLKNLFVRQKTVPDMYVPKSYEELVAKNVPEELMKTVRAVRPVTNTSGAVNLGDDITQPAFGTRTYSEDYMVWPKRNHPSSAMAGNDGAPETYRIFHDAKGNAHLLLENKGPRMDRMRTKLYEYAAIPLGKSKDLKEIPDEAAARKLLERFGAAVEKDLRPARAFENQISPNLSYLARLMKDLPKMDASRVTHLHHADMFDPVVVNELRKGRVALAGGGIAGLGGLLSGVLGGDTAKPNPISVPSAAPNSPAIPNSVTTPQNTNAVTTPNTPTATNLMPWLLGGGLGLAGLGAGYGLYRHFSKNKGKQEKKSEAKRDLGGLWSHSEEAGPRPPKGVKVQIPKGKTQLVKAALEFALPPKQEVADATKRTLTSAAPYARDGAAIAGLGTGVGMLDYLKNNPRRSGFFPSGPKPSGMLRGGVKGLAAGSIVGLLQALLRGQANKTAGALLAPRDAESEKSPFPRRSAVGDGDLPSAVAPQLTGEDAWASLANCFKGASRLKTQPDPFKGEHRGKEAMEKIAFKAQVLGAGQKLLGFGGKALGAAKPIAPQIMPTVGGGMAGGFAGHDSMYDTGSTWGNVAAGALAFNPRFSRFAYGPANPFLRSYQGSIGGATAGFMADSGLRMAGIETPTNLARVGGRVGGFAGGLSGTAGLTQGLASRFGATGLASRASNVRRFADGGMTFTDKMTNPLSLFSRAKKAPTADGALKFLNTWKGRGALAGGLAGGTLTANAAFNAAKEDISKKMVNTAEAYKQVAIPQIADYFQHRANQGMRNFGRQFMQGFDPSQHPWLHRVGAMGDPIFSRLGLDPSRMSPMQKMLLMGGVGMGAGGAMTGNPLLMGAGGAMLGGGMLMPGLGNLPNYGNLDPEVVRSIQAAYDDGTLSPEERNEWEHMLQIQNQGQ